MLNMRYLLDIQTEMMSRKVGYRSWSLWQKSGGRNYEVINIKLLKARKQDCIFKGISGER